MNIRDLSATETNLDSLQETVDKRGELFIYDAEDVFIVTPQYTWDPVPDLVIGRVSYDNWIVAYSLCSGITVIDIAKTTLMVHQTTDRGNFEGFSHNNKYYNRELIEKTGNPAYYRSGSVDCIQMRTYINYCGDYKIGRRASIPDVCSCTYWV